MPADEPKSPAAMRAAWSVRRSTGLVMVFDSRKDRQMATTNPNSMARIRMVNRFQFSSCSSDLSSSTPTTKATPPCPSRMGMATSKYSPRVSAAWPTRPFMAVRILGVLTSCAP